MNKPVLSLLRRAGRKPAYSIITFTGFVISIAASLLIYLWVYYELGYEKFHPDYQRIYRVLTLSRQGNEIVKSQGCYRPVPATMKMDYPQIEYATYISYSSEDSPLKKESGGEKIEARMCWTNEDFFRVFAGFRFTEGSPGTAFRNSNNIVLSERTSKRLFGDEKALGRILFSDKYTSEVYTVGGVVRIPEQSHIDFGFMLSDKNSRYSSYSNNWGDKGFVRVYIKLAKDARISDQFLSDITNHISRYSKISDKLMFQPLAGIHLYSDYKNDMFDKNPGNIMYVWIFSGLALLIILMASLNYAVISVAGASERSVEIGIRKVAGGSRAMILRQFMGESLVHIFAAAAVALALVWFILPWFNTLIAKTLTLTLSGGFIMNLLLLTLITGISAGIYPALYLSSFSPVAVFRKGLVSGSRRNFIRMLVTIQFAIAIFFMICASVFIKQMNFIRHKDLGFDGKNVVVIPTGLWYGNKQFKEELLKAPGILGVSASVAAPVDFAWNQGIPMAINGRNDTLQCSLFWTDEDFASTYGLKVIKGEFLRMDNRAYWDEYMKAGKSRKEGNEYAVTLPVVINETAERMMGLDDPIGFRFGDNVIVGVVRDFNFRPLQYPVGPMIITNNPETIQTMNVRIAPDNKAATLDHIRQIYMKYRDNREFDYRFFEDLLDERYLPEKRLLNITAAIAFLAIVISILGILGMAIFTTDRRTKEIGLRRVSGARSWEILLMLDREFIRWIFAAFIIASPAAWIIMNNWLQNFTYKTGISWWIFLLSGIAAFSVGFITVNWQSWRAATRNPVETLRYE